MAAARQNEMNVSITEDATISRTRSEGGATVVREDAIRMCRRENSAVQYPESEIAVRPGLSVCLNCISVNGIKNFAILGPIQSLRLLITEELFAIFVEADQDNDRRS